MNFHECMKLFYPETKIILYNQKNEVVLEGQVKDIRKECEKYHNVEVTFVSGTVIEKLLKDHDVIKSNMKY